LLGQEVEGKLVRANQRVAELEAQVRQLTYDFRRSRRSGLGLPRGLLGDGDADSVGGMTDDSFTTAGEGAGPACAAAASLMHGAVRLRLRVGCCCCP
jgi:hypothetical protein